MAVVESNIYALWGVEQSGQGTPATAGTTGMRRLRQVAGDLSLTRDDGSENYSTLSTAFGDAADYINSYLGQGDPGIQAQPDELAWLCKQFFGADSLSSTPADYGVHLFKPGSTVKWSTFFKRVGSSQIVRQAFRDCRVGQLQIEGSTANKIVRVTPTLLSLDQGVTFTADPSTAIDTADAPFVYTEGAAEYKFAGQGTLGAVTPLRGQSQFNVTWNLNLQPIFGDDVTPVDLFPGNAEVTAGITMLVDNAGLQQYSLLVYGSTSAITTAASSPYKGVPLTGAYQALVKRGTSGSTGYRGFKIEMPGAKWSPDAPISPNPDGGPVELALAGAARLVASPNDYMAQITVYSPQQTTY